MTQRLTPGDALYRPRPGRAQAHAGVHPLSKMTHQTQRFQPLPPPLALPPYHYDLEDAVPGIGASAAALGKLVFHVVGDTGGIKNPDFQIGVADAMEEDLKLTDGRAPSFFYHLGDVVYFNGEIGDYYAQFYDPYKFYTAPIIAIPGNHDGDPNTTDPSSASLDGWVRYFMTPAPTIRPESGDAQRVTLSLPNVYFTLNAPFVTLVGMYTNVPEHGSIDSQQQQWLTHEFATAPQDKALIVALHHPIYSFDGHHSGSPQMADVLQHAINDSRRIPNLTLTAHVHDYQRIERPVYAGAGGSPFLVAGMGGYHNLHKITAQNGETDSESNATLIYGDSDRHGYLTLTANAGAISGSYTATDPATAAPARNADTFQYPAAAQFLPEGVVVSL